MVSPKERFWITFMLRMSFGFLFLFVALGQFDAGGPSDSGPGWFADTLSNSYSGTWLAAALETIGFKDGIIPGSDPEERYFWPIRVFLGCIPYIFAALSVPILTGLLLRPALRFAAILLIMLGLGKYITSGNDIVPTAMNFLLAFLICVGLHFLSQEDAADSK